MNKQRKKIINTVWKIAVTIVALSTIILLIAPIFG